MQHHGLGGEGSLSFGAGGYPGRGPPPRRLVEFGKALPHLLEHLTLLHPGDLIHRVLLVLETRKPRPRGRGGAHPRAFSAPRSPPPSGGESRTPAGLSQPSFRHALRARGQTHHHAGSCRSGHGARDRTRGTRTPRAPGPAPTDRSATSAASSALPECAQGRLVHSPCPSGTAHASRCHRNHLVRCSQGHTALSWRARTLLS